ncbi:MAG: hypothetical protein QUS35_12705 [bacterium]|nr:hypothetical protein [bacterium]
MVALRAGYKSLFAKDSEEGLTFGGGVNYRMFGTSSLMLDSRGRISGC